MLNKERLSTLRLFSENIYPKLDQFTPVVVKSVKNVIVVCFLVLRTLMLTDSHPLINKANNTFYLIMRALLILDVLCVV